MKALKRLTKRSEFYVFLIIIALSLVIQARSGQFYTNNNIVDIARSMIVPLIYALCAFLAFISTGPDVSFPLVAALSSYLAITLTYKIGYEGPFILVYIFGMIFGGIMGCLNGLIIVKYKFPSLIVTLGTSCIFSGLLLGAFEATRLDLPGPLHRFGSGILLSVKNATTGLGAALPLTFLIVIVLYIIVYLVLNFTMVGRGVYAIGGDEVSAERAGFNVKGIRFGIFVANGMLAAIGGLTYSVNSMRYLPTEYAGAEMNIIAAIILGGTRMNGGVGTLTGCVLGTLLLTMVTNSLILLGVNVYWQKAFIGAIIIIGTAVTVMQSHGGLKKASKKAKKEA